MEKECRRNYDGTSGLVSIRKCVLFPSEVGSNFTSVGASPGVIVKLSWVGSLGYYFLSLGSVHFMNYDG